jgi:hypothetical protein
MVYTFILYNSIIYRFNKKFVEKEAINISDNLKSSNGFKQFKNDIRSNSSKNVRNNGSLVSLGLLFVGILHLMPRS